MSLQNFPNHPTYTFLPLLNNKIPLQVATFAHKRDDIPLIPSSPSSTIRSPFKWDDIVNWPFFIPASSWLQPVIELTCHPGMAQRANNVCIDKLNAKMLFIWSFGDFRLLRETKIWSNILKHFALICKTAKHFLNKTLNKFRGNYPDIDEQFLLKKST